MPLTKYQAESPCRNIHLMNKRKTPETIKLIQHFQKRIKPRLLLTLWNNKNQISSWMWIVFNPVMKCTQKIPTALIRCENISHISPVCAEEWPYNKLYLLQVPDQFLSIQEKSANMQTMSINQANYKNTGSILLVNTAVVRATCSPGEELLEYFKNSYVVFYECPVLRNVNSHRL